MGQPTPKQVRYHVKKVLKAFTVLKDALNDAYTANVLVYKNENYKEESPCPLVYQADARFDKCVERAIISAYQTEINREIRNERKRRIKPRG